MFLAPPAMTAPTVEKTNMLGPTNPYAATESVDMKLPIIIPSTSGPTQNAIVERTVVKNDWTNTFSTIELSRFLLRAIVLPLVPVFQ